MIRKVIETIFSRGITAICNFLAVILTAKYLGAELRGEIVLLLVSVNIVNLFQVIFSGPSLTYFAPRKNNNQILSLSAIWSILTTFAISGVLIIFNLISADLWKELLIISFFQGIHSISQGFLLGKEQISKQNILEITKSVSAISLIVFYLFYLNERTVDSIYSAYMIAFGFTSLIGIIFVLPYINQSGEEKEKTGQLSAEMLRYGIQVQFNNISQMVNYRFVFYLIEKWKGMEALGVFSVAISIGEALWIICKSIANYQTARIINTVNEEYQRVLTIISSKLSVILTSFAFAVLLFLPTRFYTWLFGAEFVDIKWILTSFGLGIISLSFFTIFNHYYSSTDRNWKNIKASLIGNAATIISGVVLVHYFGINGGAWTYGVANFIMLIVLYFSFNKTTDSDLSDYIPKIADIEILKQS